MELKAYSKINLGLDVLRKREDGYHDLRMIMQTLNLHDTVEINRRDDKKIHMICSDASLPCDESNLCVKAAKLLIDEFDLEYGVDIHLTKRIPVAAGMAGGSTDAAAVLEGINEMFQLGLSQDDLMKRGVKLGADIPYCIMKGTALAEGIGDILTRLPAIVDYPVLIAKPEEGVSTGFVYGNLKIEELVHPDIDGQIEGIKNQDIKMICDKMGNVLQTVTIPACPIIDDIKKCMMDNGAINSMMSGSGPTVFGIFPDEESCNEAAKLIEEKGYCNQIYKTSFYNV